MYSTASLFIVSNAVIYLPINCALSPPIICFKKMTLIPIGIRQQIPSRQSKENQNNNRNRHDGCTGQIRELMGGEPFCKPCIIINDFPQPSTGILAEIAQRQCHNMMNCCFPHIGRCTKRRRWVQFKAMK